MTDASRDDPAVVPEATPYDSLPVLPDLGLPHSWGIFPDQDLGALGLLSDVRVAAALSTPRLGRRIGLSRPLDDPDPPLFGREPLRHEVFQIARNSWDDRLDNFYLQASSQWDGFRHERCREHGFYGGRTDDPVTGEPWLGIGNWAERGIVGRGVLLDVGAFLADRDHAYDPGAGVTVGEETLERIAEWEGVEVRVGDILCVRFGWETAYGALDEAGRSRLSTGPLSFAGLSGGDGMARRLWDWHISALAADNPAVEVSPGDPTVGSLHRRVLALLGIPLGELFLFDALATACRDLGRWDFLFASIPLALRGGVGSPANAIAIV